MTYGEKVILMFLCFSSHAILDEVSRELTLQGHVVSWFLLVWGLVSCVSLLMHKEAQR